VFDRCRVVILLLPQRSATHFAACHLDTLPHTN
jgi:hypothetical protein